MPPRRPGGCATLLMLIGLVVVLGLALSFFAHLIVALGAIVVGVVVVLFAWSWLRRWL